MKKLNISFNPLAGKYRLCRSPDRFRDVLIESSDLGEVINSINRDFPRGPIRITIEGPLDKDSVGYIQAHITERSAQSLSLGPRISYDLRLGQLRLAGYVEKRKNE